MAEESSEAHPLFRMPPDKVTMSCMIYMARVMEVRDFVSFFFGIIKSQGEIAKLMKPESAQAFKGEAGKYVWGKYNYSTHRQFINEVMLSRAVETFDLYVLLVLREVFEARPEMLKSEGTIEISTVLELKDIGDIISYIAERKLQELSYKPLSDFRKYIQTRTGIDLFLSEEVFETVLLASEIRNLIAHNDCRPSEIFERRVPEKIRNSIQIADGGKIIISDEWLQTASYTLDSVVFDFDEKIGAKFDVKKMNRMTSFLFR